MAASTCTDIVNRALHMAGIVPRGEDAEGEEISDGMLVLQSLYDAWLAGGMFGRLRDVYESSDYEAGEGERVFLSSGDLTLPSEIDERKPRDLVAIEVFEGGERLAYLWDRTAWVRIDALEASDIAPLSSRGMNGLAACLAAHYAEEFGAQLSAGTILQARNFKTALSYKFGSERTALEAVWF